MKDEMKRKRADPKDPTMRNWLNAARSYMRPIEIGESMRAAGIGRVVASKSKSITVGDLVCLFLPSEKA
jgi:NADPH-dependent curcumin reductase CurA